MIGALAGCAVLLGACSDIYLDRRESISFSAGDAVATNRVLQMVDPWPPHSANKNIAFNGEKMQTAVERYRHNKVIPPVGIATSNYQAQQAQQAQQAASGSAAAAAPVK
jgi:hypothetical protein